MTDLLPLSIGIGLAVSLIFSESFGIAAGGMVVPGYFALYLTHPLEAMLTLAVGFATFGIVHALSAIVIVYGRRRTVLMILMAYILGMAVRAMMPDLAPDGDDVVKVIGFIIPGLVAIWLDRQGVVETVSALATASVVVRLVLILLVGTELLR
jgi:poly-gamma-glutamate biosynthesis protein PgsC/CapC